MMLAHSFRMHMALIRTVMLSVRVLCRWIMVTRCARLSRLY